MKKIVTKLGAIAMSAAMALTLAPSAALTSLAKEEREDRDIPGAVMQLSVPVYGFYNPNSGEHLFTVDLGEADNLGAAGWTEGDIKWYAPTLGDPVYRLYNPNEPLGDHHYTTSAAEVEILVEAGWRNEEAAFYTADTDFTFTVPVYGVYNPNAYPSGMTGAHHFTINKEEADSLLEKGWLEGEPKFYGFEVDVDEAIADQIKVEIDTETPYVGDILTATVDPGYTDLTYHWLVGGTETSTAEMLTVTDDMLGKVITLMVTNADGYTSTSEPTQPVVEGPEAPDYADADSWYEIPAEITKDVDTFFIYPTKYLGSNKSDPDYAPIDNQQMINGIKEQYDKFIGDMYGSSTNLYIPIYRQASFRVEAEVWKKTGNAMPSMSGIPYDDIEDALDYYFEYLNDGRPFILAGHSQGSAICLLALERYFSEHPEYLDRMVATYAIGFSVTSDYLEENPHLKFATGEDDTGVIVSWNSEGSESVEQGANNIVLLPNAISINPLNWKLDDTYASADENLGSLVTLAETGENSIQDIGADAQIDLERGVVVTNANIAPISMKDLFGPASFHNNENMLYYVNQKENIEKRIDSYLMAEREN